MLEEKLSRPHYRSVRSVPSPLVFDIWLSCAMRRTSWFVTHIYLREYLKKLWSARSPHRERSVYY